MADRWEYGSLVVFRLESREGVSAPWPWSFYVGRLRTAAGELGVHGRDPVQVLTQLGADGWLIQPDGRAAVLVEGHDADAVSLGHAGAVLAGDAWPLAPVETRASWVRDYFCSRPHGMPSSLPPPSPSRA